MAMPVPTEESISRSLSPSPKAMASSLVRWKYSSTARMPAPLPLFAGMISAALSHQGGNGIGRNLFPLHVDQRPIHNEKGDFDFHSHFPFLAFSLL